MAEAFLNLLLAVSLQNVIRDNRELFEETLRRTCARQPPDESREQQRDADLHGRDERRVVDRVAVARRADVAAEVDAVREARAHELGRKRQQPERQGRKEALMTARPLHVGRSTIVVVSELRDGEGRLVAQVTQSQAVLGSA